MSETGILLVNKPVGISTFDVIRRFKKATDFEGKIGHAGTLDVFASGLIILLLNTTKDFARFQTLKKYYQAQVRLGISSTTLDIEGKLTDQKASPKPEVSQILAAFQPFLGPIDQSIPAYSAAKYQGQPLYKHALKGTPIIHKSKPVTIYSLDLLAYKYPLVNTAISCSSGTYIRQLTADIFTSLNIDSFLFGLVRTQIGEYHLENAISLDQLSLWKEKLVSINL